MAVPTPVDDNYVARTVTAPGQQESVAALANQVTQMGNLIGKLIAKVPDGDLTVPEKTLMNVEVNVMTAQASQIRTAGDDAIVQYKLENEVPIVTRIPPVQLPAADGGEAPDDLPELKSYKLEDFKGETGKTDCLTWLSKLMEVAETKKLTPKQIKQLIVRHSGGAVSQVLDALKRSNAQLEEVVRTLEVNYAGLQSTEAARAKVDSATRKPDETILVFGQRVRMLAFMASRLSTEAVKQELELTKSAVTRCLTVSVKATLNERIKARRLQGAPEMQLMSYLSAIEDIEEMRRIRKSARGLVAGVQDSEESSDPDMSTEEEMDVLYAQQQQQRQDKKSRTATAATGTAPKKSQKTYGDSKVRGKWKKQYSNQISELQQEVASVVDLVKALPAVEHRLRSPTPHPGHLQPLPPAPAMANMPQGVYWMQQQPAGPQQVWQQPTWQQPAGQKQQQGQQMQPRGRPSRGNTPVRAASKSKSPGGRPKIDPAKFNVGVDACVKCGLDGHFAWTSAAREYCPFWGRDLTPEVCSRCKIGGHLATACVRNRMVPVGATGN